MGSAKLFFRPLSGASFDLDLDDGICVDFQTLSTCRISNFKVYIANLGAIDL